ncbi:MAG: TetR/AcrR family transcriptional regulator [Sphingomonadales bacterium]|nr:TetR/AcrR family transcriptional regulator [Sphingomonadales bacterium]
MASAPLLSPVAACGKARGKGRPRLAEARAIDVAIRAAALRVILEQGEAATLHAVAQSAGLSRKTLYARYANRTALFTEVIRTLLVTTGSLNFEDRGSLAERLHNYILAAQRAIEAPRAKALRRLLAVDPAYIASLRDDLMAASRNLFFNPLLRLLEAGAASGEIVVTDAALTARLLMRLIFADGTEFGEGRLRRTEGDPAIAARLLTDFVMHGLLPRG